MDTRAPEASRPHATHGARRSRRAWVSAAYAVVLIGLTVLQPADYVGDEGEYLAVAIRLGRLQRPSLDEPDYEALRAELAPDGIGVLAPRIARRDGRRDFGHFYAYSALAAPLVSAVRAAGLPPKLGFLILHVVLLGLAMYVASGRLPWSTTWLLCLGPIIWWVGRDLPRCGRQRRPRAQPSMGGTCAAARRDGPPGAGPVASGDAVVLSRFCHRAATSAPSNQVIDHGRLVPATPVGAHRHRPSINLGRDLGSRPDSRAPCYPVTDRR